MLKSTLHRYIIDNEMLLATPHEVFLALQAIFNTPKWEKAHEHAAISKLIFYWIPAFDRASADSVKVSAIEGHTRGVRALYSFDALSQNRLASRVFSCWCESCVICGEDRTADDQALGCKSEENGTFIK